MKSNHQRRFAAALTEMYGQREVKNMWRVLQEDLFNSEGYDNLDKIIEQLLDDVPVQYITGLEFFYSHPFRINNHVLIPRPETEELVEWVISEQKSADLSILDIGTGCGCIAITLKLANPLWEVSGMEISRKALDVADLNALELGADVNLFQGDMTIAADYPEEIDIIVSNPPYVMKSDSEMMTPSVDRYEPHVALYAPDGDPLHFYESVMSVGTRKYKKGTIFYFEIHHLFVDDLISLCLKYNLTNYKIKNDLEGLPRMLRCSGT